GGEDRHAEEEQREQQHHPARQRSPPRHHAPSPMLRVSPAPPPSRRRKCRAELRNPYGMRIDTHHFGIGTADSVHTPCTYWRQVSLAVIHAAARHAVAARRPMRMRSRRARGGDTASSTRLTWMWAPRRDISGTERKMTAASR